MRITELLESTNSHNLSLEKDKYGLDFDLVEDLVYFMHHDDDTYRRYVYPTIVKCLHKINNTKSTHPVFFKSAATESYKKYVDRFKLRELPDTLDNDLIRNVCERLHDEFCKHAAEGLYQDATPLKEAAQKKKS